MKKTLLLCFIHGFKGGESTFGQSHQFTNHLQLLVAKALPNVNVKVLVYPKYETRGNLGEAVSRFRDWLQDKVIDLEVAAGTPSPTISPSIRTVLVGHSMGGIVAAETVMALASDQPITIPPGEGGIASHSSMSEQSLGAMNLNGLMFPYVEGVLAFDTPYLGIAPGVVAHGAESHFNAASQAVNQLGGLAGFLGGGRAGAKATAGEEGQIKALPAPESGLTAASSRPESQQQQQQQQQQGSRWGSLGKIAAFAGAGAVIAGAGAAAAYLGKDRLVAAGDWVGSHLEFIGTLARSAELRRRIAFMVKANEEIGIGFANFYTKLGKGVNRGSIWTADGSSPFTRQGEQAPCQQRTFCNLPSGNEPAGRWIEAVNDMAEDETAAHMNMFEPSQNPGYKKLVTDARDLIVGWANSKWYESSDGNFKDEE